jgi:hypothetical protein
MADLKQLKCPSCGAVLDFDFPNQIVATCPYCHQQVVYKDDEINNYVIDSFDKKDIKKYGVPFKDSDDEFRKRIIKKIAYDNGTPLDVFSKAIIRDAKKIYVPLYYYSGNFQASWSSMVMHYKDAQRINYQGKLENYKEEDPHYISGNSTGRFVSIASAVDVDSINKHIYSYLKDNNTLDMLKSNFVMLETNDDSVSYLSCDYGSEKAWNSVGESWAEANAWHHCDFPGRTQSFSATFSEISNSLYYIPVRMVEFLYEGKSYICVEVMNEYYFDYPIIEGYSGDTEKNDSDDDPGCWVAIIGIVVALLLNWTIFELYDLIGLKGNIHYNLSYITTWLLFFSAFLYFRSKESVNITSKKYVEKGELLIVDIVVAIFLSIGVTYVGFYLNDYVGLADYTGFLCFLYFILSVYLFCKFRLYEINKYNKEVNEHNDRIGAVFASYRKQKLDTSNSFKWNWNMSTNERNVQINDESMGEIVNDDLDQHSDVLYCRHCGKKLKTGYKFCGYCGNKQ